MRGSRCIFQICYVWWGSSFTDQVGEEREKNALWKDPTELKFQPRKTWELRLTNNLSATPRGRNKRGTNIWMHLHLKLNPRSFHYRAWKNRINLQKPSLGQSHRNCLGFLLQCALGDKRIDQTQLPHLRSWFHCPFSALRRKGTQRKKKERYYWEKYFKMKDGCKLKPSSVLRDCSVATLKESAKMCSTRIPLVTNFSSQTSVRRNSLRVTQIDYSSMWYSVPWEITLACVCLPAWLHLSVRMHVYCVCVYSLSLFQNHTHKFSL